MRRWPVGVVVAIAVVGAACAAGTSSAHADRCHAERTCPSDDHSYVWSGMSCTSSSALRGPEDQLPIDHGGRRYWCHVVVDGEMTPRPVRPPDDCLVERGGMRTLTDRAAGEIRPAVTVTTAAKLAALPPPRSFAQRATGAERTRYRVRGRLKSASRGPGAEIRVVLADLASDDTITVVFPSPACAADAAASHRRSMAAARAGFIRACGDVARGTSRRLGGTATVTGVGFFAPSRPAGRNGFALAPALEFSADCRRR